MVTADEPTGTSLGVTEEMASSAGVTPTPEADPEVAGAPPHPDNRVTRERQKNATRRRKTQRPSKIDIHMESADDRNPVRRAGRKRKARPTK
jgi:hypothetical protein